MLDPDCSISLWTNRHGLIPLNEESYQIEFFFQQRTSTSVAEKMTENHVRSRIPAISRVTRFPLTAILAL